MKRIQEASRWTVPAASLTLDDVEEMLEVIRAHCKKATIKAGGYEFDSLDELKTKYGTRPKELALAGTSPWVDLVLAGEWGGDLDASGDSEAQACFLKLQRILLSRRKLVSYLPGPSVAFPVFFVALGIDLVATLSRAHLGIFWKVAYYAATVLPLFSLLARSRFAWSIVLERPHERKTFWKRKGDEIVMRIIVAVMAGIGGWVAARLFGK
jgi:hypothetical protein